MPGFTQIPNDYVFDDPLWTSEPQTKGSAHSDLYRLAQFKPGLVNKRGNLIELEPGQIGWSMVELSKRWKRSLGWVRRLLNYLEKAGHIVQQKTNVSTTITLLHYGDHGIAERTADGSQKEQQTDSRRYPNNIVNTEKIEKRGKSNGQNYSLTKEVLNELQDKHPNVEVKDSYDRFVNHHKSKGTYLADVKAGFENWLKGDEKYGNHPRKKENKETIFYCVNVDCKCFGKTKKVKNERDMSHPHCDDCEHQMGKEYEYNLTLIRIDKEKKEHDYEKNK